jgi:hypothetical protein
MNLQFFISHYIKGAYYKNFVILDYSDKRKTILKYAQKYNCSAFIETGTFFGDTTDFLKDHFQQLYTIELQEDLFRKAWERFKTIDRVSVLQGDSAIVLQDIVPRLNMISLFWLDGHYSSSFFVGDELIVTAKGKKESPIIEELDIILKNGLNKNVILIDDARCFDGTHDYPTMKELKLFLKKFDILDDQVKIKNDIIRITPVV